MTNSPLVGLLLLLALHFLLPLAPEQLCSLNFLRKVFLSASSQDYEYVGEGQDDSADHVERVRDLGHAVEVEAARVPGRPA